MSNPLRILHAVVNMNRGGAETLIMNLYRNIDRSKVQFDFLTCKEGMFDSEIIQLGGKVHRIPYVTDVGHFGYIKALNHFFSSHSEYRIVHSHMNQMSGFVLRAAKKAGVPVRIVHSHNTSSEGGFLARTYKSYAGNFISTCSTHLLACSSDAAKWLFADNANKSVILKNGIECDKFSFSQNVREQIREEFNLASDQLVIGHVGRFTKQKNHSFLIDIFAQLTKVQRRVVLMLVGDGPLRKEMEQRVEELGLVHHVKFLGIRSDIERLLQSFDVLAFPSFHEGLPLALIEAQRAGLPCVISDTISKEVDMGAGLVKYVCINNLGHWVNTILDITTSWNVNRAISSERFVKNGYDIKNTAEWTQDFYLEVRGESIEETYGVYSHV